MKKETVEEDFGFQPFDLDEDEQFDADLDKEEDEFGFELADKDEENEIDATEETDENPEPEEEEKKEETSFWQKVASHPITQTILGAAQGLTAPLDLLKMAMLGEGLSGVEELEDAFRERGVPFDREEYINNVYEAASLIPTQSLAEEKIKEHTGIDLEPKDTFSKIVRFGTEIASSGPLSIGKQAVKQGEKQLAKQLAKRSVGGISAAAGAEGAKSLGANESLVDTLAAVLGGSAGAKKEPFKLTGQQAKNANTAEKHNLRKFGGLQREEPLANATVSKTAQKKATEELGESSKKAIDKVIADKIPITKQRAMGINLEKAAEKAYNQTSRKAKQLDSANAAAKNAGEKTKEINLQPMLNKIKKKIKDIQKTAPSLSPSDKAAIKELKKQYKALTVVPKATKPIYGPNGQVLNPPSKVRQPKQITAEQALDQYKNFNEETKGIYRKAEYTGNEEVVKNLYGELKSDLIESIEKASPELGGDLKFANKIYHETSKLNQVEDLLSKAFDQGYNPKKLNQILGSKRNRAFLERDLGKGAVKDMQDIARYGMDAEKSVLQAVKNPKTVKEIVSEITPLKAALLFTKGTAGLPLVIAHDIPKEIARRARGAIMLSPKTRQSYADFVKHAISPQSAGFKKASQELTKSIEEEYGSEKEFLKSLESEED